VSVPYGVSHVAVVTGDLGGYRASYEEVMLHVVELPGYDPTVNGFGLAMSEHDRLDHLGYTVPDVTALDTVRDPLVAVDSSTLRDQDDVVNPWWFARMASALHADPTEAPQ